MFPSDLEKLAKLILFNNLGIFYSILIQVRYRVMKKIILSLIICVWQKWEKIYLANAQNCWNMPSLWRKMLKYKSFVFILLWL